MNKSALLQLCAATVILYLCPRAEAQVKRNIYCIEQPDPDISKRSAKTSEFAQPPCGGPTDPPPPAGPPPYNYGLNWTYNLTQYVNMGGVSGRQGPGVDVFNNQFYIAYTSAQDPVPGDQDGDQFVYISTPLNSGQPPYALINSQTGQVSSDANPALLTIKPGVSSTYPNGFLLLQVNSQQRQGISGFSDSFQIITGPTGVTGPWNVASGQFPVQTIVDYSPSLATDGTWIYLGLRNASDHTLVLCRESVNLTNATCQYFPGSRPMNFNPSLAVVPSSGLLLIGYEEYDNTHALRVFTSADQGQTISENTNITSVNEDTTSTAPSIAYHNGAMYLGFRTNDSDRKFLYRYSLDGFNWSARIDPNYSMGGAPTLVDANKFLPNNTSYGNTLYNFFSSNDSNHALVQWIGTSN